MQYNQYDQPIGDSLPSFSAGERPAVTQLEGKFCRLEKLDAQRHFDDLWHVYSSHPRYWTYLPLDPFDDKAKLADYLTQLTQSADPYYFAIIDKQSGKALGTFALMRIDTQNRIIEMGWVIYSPELQRTRIATEAQFLLAQYVFETLQYRRYEWKCDNLNAPSKRAAERLGFHYEGTFRQAQVYKGRTRDTAWFSMLDSEWQAQKARFLRYLDEQNFDAQGKQIKALADC